MTPVVIGVSGIQITFGMAAGCRIEVREVAWIRKKGGDNNDEHENADEASYHLSSRWFFGVAFVKVSQGFSDEHVEKRQNGKEVTEANIEVAGDADVAVKEDEEGTEVLGDAILQGVTEETADPRILFFEKELDDSIETIESGGNK